MRKYRRRYEDAVEVNADPKSVFAYADDHSKFSSHMNSSSWMMGGGKMETVLDEEKGQKVGSHIRMGGNVFGINLFLDEVVTLHEPPFRKEWETVGNVNLVVIDQYRLGFKIEPMNNVSRFSVYIDYNLPKSAGAYILGLLFGEMYAKWCVKQMLRSVTDHFRT